MNGFDVVELACQEISHQCSLSLTAPACAFGSGRRSSSCPYRMKDPRAADAVFHLQFCQSKSKHSTQHIYRVLVSP